MKTLLAIATGLLISASAGAQAPAGKPQVCWIETASSTMDGAMGGAGLLHTKVWHSTLSVLLVRDEKGDVLIDTGYGPNAEMQMNELPEAGRAFGLMVVSGSKDRKPIADALATVGEKPEQIARILITHAHYDHLGGATQLAAPIYVSSAEAAWMTAQEAHPTITPPSLIAAVKPRLKVLTYDSGPYLGFKESKDIYGDGTLVVVPLPGHTPGSLGVFVKLGQRSVFMIGDAADTLEAAERGLPKSPAIRTNADFEPDVADSTTKRISDFHRAHPDITIIPAHDRTVYTAVFGSPASCVAAFH